MAPRNTFVVYAHPSFFSRQSARKTSSHRADHSGRKCKSRLDISRETKRSSCFRPVFHNAGKFPLCVTPPPPPMFWRNSVRKIGPLSCVGILRARSSTQKSHYFLCCVQRDPSFGQGRLGKSSQECFFIWRTHEVFPEPPSSLRVFLFVVRKIGSGDHPRGGGRHRGCIILRTTSSQRQRFLIIRVRNAHPMDSQRKTLFPFFFTQLQQCAYIP